MIRSRASIMSSYSFVNSPIRIFIFFLKLEYNNTLFRKKIWNRWYNRPELLLQPILNFWVRDVNRLIFLAKRTTWSYLFKMNTAYPYLHYSNSYCLVYSNGLPLTMLCKLKWKINLWRSNTEVFLSVIFVNNLLFDLKLPQTLSEICDLQAVSTNQNTYYQLIRQAFKSLSLLKLVFDVWSATWSFKYSRMLIQSPILINYILGETSRSYQLTKYSNLLSKKWVNKTDRGLPTNYFTLVKIRKPGKNLIQAPPHPSLNAIRPFNALHSAGTYSDSDILRPSYINLNEGFIIPKLNLSWVKIVKLLLFFIVHTLIIQIKRMQVLLLSSLLI